MAKIELEQVDFGEGGGTFLTRAGASIKITQEGKVGFLESQFGPGNVFTLENGDIVIRDENGRLAPFDEEGISFKDVTADLVGPGINVAPFLVAGSNPVTAGAAGAAGAAIRQAASAALPGDEGMTAIQRATDIALGGAFGAGGAVLVRTGAKAFDALRPHNFAGRQVRKAIDTAFAKKGLRLEEQTGIPLSVGEVTGHRGTLAIEAIARRLPSGSDEFFIFHQRQLQAATANLRRQMERLGAPKGEFQVGADVIKAFDDAVESARTIRASQAATDFGYLHRISGGQRVITTNNLRGEIQRLVQELDVPGAGDATSRLLNSAKKLLKDLGDQPLTGEQANRLLQLYTNAQKGTGVIFKDMEKNQSRFIAGRLKDALLTDLDDTIAAGTSAEIVTALKVARSNYSLNSKAINELADSTLARVIGNRTASPEAIAEKFVLRLKPSQVSEAMKVIENASPETARSIRRFFIETAINNARPPMSQATAAGMKFSATRFVSSLPDMDTLKAAGFTRQEVVELGQVAKALERVADKALEGSPTAPFAITWDAISGVFTLNPITLGRAAVTIFAPKKIARATLTPEGRQALLTLATTSPQTKQAATAAAALMATLAVDVVTPGPNIKPMPGFLQ